MVLAVRKLKGNYYTIAYHLFETIFNEIKFHEHSTNYLTREEFKALCQYYATWMKSKYWGHYFAQRLKTLVKFIIDSDSVQPSVLDCGCGFGSESIACALLGCNVVGIDLDKERVSIAEKRAQYYNEKFDAKLNIDFLIKDVLKYKPKRKFDFIYAKEFISHVWSLPAFFKFARKVLKERGYLIVTDANLFNPLVALKAYLDHRTALFTVVPNPETGEKVPYARERLFSPRYITEVFIQHNFRPTSINMFGYIPPISQRFLNVAGTFEGIVSKIPIGASYEITGIKL